MKSKIRLVIFDLDGTLVDAYQAVRQSVNYALTKNGYPAVSYGVIKRKVGWGDRNLIAGLVDGKDLDHTLKDYRRHHRQALKKYAKLLPGAKRILQRLKRGGYQLAVASNRPSLFSRSLLRQLKIAKYFDCVLCADQVQHPKPHPALLRTILKRLSCRRQEAVYVGDMIIDVQAGRRAGIKTIAVTTGSSFLSELTAARPGLVIQRISQLSEVFKTGA